MDTRNVGFIFKKPSILPSKWKIFEELEDGYKYVNYDDRQIVIISWAKENDNKIWIHFSMSASASIPSWEDFRNAKELFLGCESKAIQIIPPRSEYVNINKRVLHLFVCTENDGLPDFTGGGGTL